MYIYLFFVSYSITVVDLHRLHAIPNSLRETTEGSTLAVTTGAYR